MGKWLIFFALGSFSSALYANQPNGSDSKESEPAASLQTEETPRPALRSRHQLELQRLQQAWPKQFRPLTSEHDQAGALYLPANHGEPRGWVILLPGSGQPADAVNSINRLRQLLPDTGWHTLSLQLPATDFIGLHVSPPPEIQPADNSDGEQTDTGEPSVNTDEAAPSSKPNTEAEELTEETEPTEAETINEEDTTSQPDHAQRMLALIDVAVTMARADLPRQLVLLGQQEGAHWATLWANEQQTEALDDVLVLLEPRETPGLPSLEELIGDISLQVADFHFGLDQGSQDSARQRLNSSKRNPDSRYHQVKLSEPAPALREEVLVRRVKSWLTTFDAN